MSRIQSRHMLLRTETVTRPDGEVTYQHALCGYDSRSGFISRAWVAIGDTKDCDCGACCKRYGQQLLKARDTSAPDLEVRPDKAVRISGARSGTFNEILLAGEHIGYTAYHDRKWRIYGVGRGYKGVGLGATSALNDKGGQSIQGLYGYLASDTLGYGSKELALLAAEDLHAQGRLPTLVEQDAQAARENREARESAVAFRRARDEKAQRNRDTLEGLECVLENKVLHLSNFERAALANAISDYKGKIANG